MPLGEHHVEKIVLAEPRGFCAGVDRAVEAVRGALRTYGRPLYVRHQIVHNRFVLEALVEEGAIFVEPVEGAAGGNHVDGGVRHGGCFGGGVDDFQMRPAFAKMVERCMHLFAHVQIWFDGEDTVAVFEEYLGEHAGARADVCDEPIGFEAAPSAQVAKDFFRWVTLAIAVVVFGAAGEAMGVVGHKRILREQGTAKRVSGVRGKLNKLFPAASLLFPRGCSLTKRSVPCSLLAVP